jgi:hypothetical protein
MFVRLADNRDPRSLAARLRRQRFALFSELLIHLPDPVSILDVGGTEGFWQAAPLPPGRMLQVTLLNLNIAASTNPGIRHIAGDTRASRCAMPPSMLCSRIRSSSTSVGSMIECKWRMRSGGLGSVISSRPQTDISLLNRTSSFLSISSFRMLFRSGSFVISISDGSGGRVMLTKPGGSSRASSFLIRMLFAGCSRRQDSMRRSCSDSQNPSWHTGVGNTTASRKRGSG